MIRLFVGSKLYILVFKTVCQLMGGCLKSSRSLEGFDKVSFICFIIHIICRNYDLKATKQYKHKKHNY